MTPNASMNSKLDNARKNPSNATPNNSQYQFQVGGQAMHHNMRSRQPSSMEQKELKMSESPTNEHKSSQIKIMIP